MQTAVVDWLDHVGSAAFTMSAWAFVILNGAGVAVLTWKRDRSLVNRWTSRFLAVNLMLLGMGLGIPVAAMAVRTAIAVLLPAVQMRPTAGERRDDAALPRAEIRP
jgi:hypothetical protein